MRNYTSTLSNAKSPFTQTTDHKSVESICQKQISLAPLRLQQMLLRLRLYNPKVKYVGAKSVLMADTLSRLIKQGTDPAIPNLDVGIAEVLKIKPTTLESLQEETKADPMLSPLHEHIIHGWPDKRQELVDNLLPYWCLHDELTILDGLIVKGNRVVVPSVLRIEHCVGCMIVIKDSPPRSSMLTHGLLAKPTR